MNNCNTFFKILTYKRLLIKNKTGHTVAIGQKLLVKIVYVRRCDLGLGNGKVQSHVYHKKRKSVQNPNCILS